MTSAIAEHAVKIEDFVIPPREGARLRCIAGENACPQEDVGGPNAYFDFLRNWNPITLVTLNPKRDAVIRAATESLQKTRSAA